MSAGILLPSRFCPVPVWSYDKMSVPDVTMRFSKLSKLILKELLPTLIIALAVMSFVAFSKEFRRMSQMLITAGTSFTTFAIVIMTVLANVFTITLPIALLAGIVACFSRLNTDNEIVALKSGGISVLRMLRPVLLVAVLTFLATFFLSTIGAPTANSNLRNLQYELALSQISTDVQPRVFNDRFRKLVFYFEDLEPSRNIWKGIFIADETDPRLPKIYLARAGRIFSNATDNFLQLHLDDGLIYSNPSEKVGSDSVTHFGSLDIPLKELNITPPDQIPKKNPEKSMAELAAEIHSGLHLAGSDPQIDLEVEYHRRIAIPFACFVFALIGVPLGITTRKGGRSLGFVLSLFVVFGYYLTFVYSWKAGVFYKIFPISFGVWIANILFTAIGIALLWQANGERHPVSKLLNRPLGQRFFRLMEWIGGKLQNSWQGFRSGTRLEKIVQVERPIRFTRVLDLYILKEFVIILTLTIASSVIIFTVFSLFEILDEIFKNRIPWSHVVTYYFFVWPMIISLVLPLCILISLLICFGLLEKSNQIMALKACGISLYRIASPVAAFGILLAIGIFALQEFILPYTNQRQDILYNEIKGRKVQTLGPDVTWIMGGDGRIYNYRHFDYRHKEFADLSVYGVDLANAQLSWRYFAPSARWEDRIQRWVLLNGWSREFDHRSPALSRFTTLAADLKEKPDYFKTEVKQSNKMSFGELSGYIEKLKQSGFDTLSLEVDLYSKTSYPVASLIMLLIGLPFAFKMGNRGALYGMAVSILLGILFWALFNLFTAMGGYGILPPLLAAWAPNLFFGFGGFYLALNIRT